MTRFKIGIHVRSLPCRPTLFPTNAIKSSKYREFAQSNQALGQGRRDQTEICLLISPRLSINLVPIGEENALPRLAHERLAYRVTLHDHDHDHSLTTSNSSILLLFHLPYSIFSSSFFLQFSSKNSYILNTKALATQKEWHQQPPPPRLEM